mmetsp:Transcript_27125/g.41285  ORF Transcript_27125/g.41285 Transcript_27125/m.41285 type:complete len:227 (+) Transcript_27125:175-855(+)
MNQSIGDQTRVGDLQADVRSNYGAGIEKSAKEPGSDSKKVPKENRDEVTSQALKTLPKPINLDGKSIHNRAEEDDDPPFEMAPIENRRCCRRTGDVEDHIDINLDSVGKNLLVLSFTLMQLVSVFVTCLKFSQFYQRNCSPVAYQPINAFDISIDTILIASTGAAIFLKFVSIVCLSLAFDEYQNLGSNISYLFTALISCTALSCLVAPLYTFDHAQCVPSNFLVP